MLGKLDLNKFIVSIILIFNLSNCKFSKPMATLAVCENNKKILLKDITIDEVKTSISKGIYEKNEYNFSPSYTVISGKLGSVMIYNFKLEEFNRCQLRYVSYYKNYWHFQRR